jgi:hypothetical protein
VRQPSASAAAAALLLELASPGRAQAGGRLVCASRCRCPIPHPMACQLIKLATSPNLAGAENIKVPTKILKYLLPR